MRISLLLVAVLPLTLAAQNAEGRWNGPVRMASNSFQSMGGGSTVGSNIAHYAGSLELTPSTALPGGWHIDLRVNGGKTAETIEWGISKTRCGSPITMLERAEQLRPIDMTSNGNGEVADDQAFKMFPDSTYSAVLFKGGRATTNVVACANLRFSKK